jgi:hypothetical protein
MNIFVTGSAGYIRSRQDSWRWQLYTPLGYEQAEERVSDDLQLA